MEHVINLRSAVTLLGRFPALAGVDLTVERGQIVLLAGPNGAGKTTLLKLCAGLLTVHDGEAVVLGHDLRRDRRAVRARVGLLGHANGLYDDLTVAENVDFWARVGGASRPEVDAALDRLGLGGRLAAVPAARLSAGQRRRTALAALVARRPELWLLDEPHAGLDEAGRDLLDGLLHTAAAAGATVVVASHDHERARALADRCVRLAGGRTMAHAAFDGPDRPSGALRSSPAAVSPSAAVPRAPAVSPPPAVSGVSC